MQVESHSPPAFEDFFNMDMLQSPSSSSSSRSSSPSTASLSYSFIPPSSPQIASYNDNNSFFNFSSYLDDEYTKLAPTSTPYDFLGAFNILASNPSVSSSSASPESLSVDSPTLAIDPQLVDSPSSSKALSDFGHDEDHGNEHDEDDDDDQSATIPAVKVGGLGKLRKGTVASGGIVKKSAFTSHSPSTESPSYSTSTMGGQPMSSVVRDGKKENIDMMGDDWRPSPEEYKKMSSKEKRQLRNKISARNFRVRRKEYISTLEGDIAERDRLLDAIRSELGSSKSENTALRQEISSLKKALLAGRGVDAPVLPPPGPLPSPVASTSSASSPSNATSPANPTKDLLTPNTQKDLPTSPRGARSAFWGGNLSMGGITPVHTVIMPELQLGLGLSRKGLGMGGGTLMENINPALNFNSISNANVNINTNNVPSNPLASANAANTNASRSNSLAPHGLGLGLGIGGTGFEGFVDTNPFTLKTLDAYRMQLWGKMAVQQQLQHHQQLYAQQQQQNQNQNQNYNAGYGQSQQLSGLASNLRPSYFASSSTSALSGAHSGNLAGLLSGKSSSSSSSSSPNELASAFSGMSLASGSGAQEQRMPQPTKEQAMLAAIASQTLLKKLGGAFWDAFSGSSASASSTSSSSTSPSAFSAPTAPKGWDADKVRRVLEGKAVVRVVDLEPTPTPSLTPISAPTLTSTSLGSTASTSSRTSSAAECREKCSIALGDLLAESMGSLSLAKKGSV